MIKIFKTPTCAYCRQVCQFLDRKGVAYDLEEAEGVQYYQLADKFGMTVPLIYNDETEAGMVGYDIPRIMRVVGLA